MAIVNNVKRKELDKIRREKSKKFKEQLKKFNKNPIENFGNEQEPKDNILELYQKMSPSQKAIFDKELENKKIRDNYALYLKHIYPNYVFTPFHALLCNICQSVVEKVENGQKVRMCLSVPPQHGKSHTVTETLPSWFVGRNPDLRAILTAYNADIAEKFGNKNRQLVKDFGEELFGIKISESQDNKTLWDIDKHKGGLYSAGILGGITSNTSQLTIVDDPFKNGAEAENPDIREKVWQTFVDSVLTRSQGKGNAVIVIHTRWHDDDLIGRLAKLGGWIIINIPCVWEKGVDKMLGRKIGQTLCPELGFDSEWATQMAKVLGAKKWNALYQGKPYIDGGNLVKRSSLKFYTHNTRPSVFDTIEMSCDLTFGGKKNSNDNVCIGVWGRVGADHYLLQKVKKKMTFQETLQQLRVLADKYPQCRKKIVEAKANGLATIETLNREIGGFVEFDPKSKSKQERFENAIPFIESGNVWLPDENIDPTIEDDIDELLRFPSGAHDDFVDMLSQYLLNYEYRYGGKIDTDNRFSMFAKAIRGF
jgi:predicted phage terminase large subunit-like protein